MGKIPESTSLKISDFIFRFRESSQKFVVEILTQNFAFNLSGTLFFIGLGCSLKWWYKDQLLITLLKQNLPAFSQPQQKISWEIGEYLIGEQTRQFIGKKPTFGVCTLGLRRCTKGLPYHGLHLPYHTQGVSSNNKANQVNPIFFNPNVGAESMHNFENLEPRGEPLGSGSGLRTNLFSDQVASSMQRSNQDCTHSAEKKIYEKTAVRGSEAEWISSFSPNKALSDHVDEDLQYTEGVKKTNNALIYNCPPSGITISVPNKQKNNIRFAETRDASHQPLKGGARSAKTETMLQKVNLLFTPQVRNLSVHRVSPPSCNIVSVGLPASRISIRPCSFNDLLDRTDVYSNSVVINFRSPWQKHAYHRFVGIFPELICADTRRGTETMLQVRPRAEKMHPCNIVSVDASEMQPSVPSSPSVLPSATSVPSSASSTSTKLVDSVFKKYTFWGPPKNWLKLSARGLCILNQPSPLTSSNYCLHGVDRLWTFFRKPPIQTLKFPFNAICEIPEKNIVVAFYEKADASNQPFQGRGQLVKVIGENEDAFTEHYFAPLVVDQISPSQLASSMDDKARTLLGIEKVKSSVQKIDLVKRSGPLTGTDLLYSTILNKGLAELSVIVNNRSFVDGINFRVIREADVNTTKEKAQVLSTQTKNLSYPLELTPKMDGWQPPVEKLFLNSYLDEIPYKLENTLWATTRQISNRRLGLCNSNWPLLGSSYTPNGVKKRISHEGGNDEMFPKNKDQTLIKSTKKLDKGVAGSLPPFWVVRKADVNTTSNQPLKSMEKKLQLIRIKQLLKNELQILVNSLPIIFVDRSSRLESNYQANNMESCTRSAPRGTWLIPNRKKLDDLCTFGAEQIGGVKKREIQGAEGLHLHLPVHKVHELDRHKEEKSTQQKVSPTSPFVYEEKEKIAKRGGVDDAHVDGVDDVDDGTDVAEGKTDGDDVDIRFADNSTDVAEGKTDEMLQNAFSVVSRDTSSLFTKRTLIDQGKPPLISGSQTKGESIDSFFLLNSLGITFNNLSYLKDPPVLLPMNQDASFWRWNRKKVGMSIMHRLRRADLMHGLRRFGGTDEMSPKNTITPYVKGREGSERLNSLARQDNEKIVTDTTFRFDPNTMTWQVLQQLNCDQSPKNWFKSSASSLSAPFSASSMSMQQKSKTPTLHHAKKREDKKLFVQKTTRSAKRVHFINQIILKQKKISLATNSFTSSGCNINSVPSVPEIRFFTPFGVQSASSHTEGEPFHDVTSPIGANAKEGQELSLHLPVHKVHDNSQIAPTFEQHLISPLDPQADIEWQYSPIASTLYFAAQQELELRKIDNINLVDTQVSLTNKRGRLMSGYIYPDTQSASLMPNLYRWTYSAFPFNSTCNISSVPRASISPITLAKSTDKKVRGGTNEMLQNPKANLFSTDGDKNLAPLRFAIHDCLLHSKMFTAINRLVDKACLFKVCTSGAPTICRLPWSNDYCTHEFFSNKCHKFLLPYDASTQPLNKANINRVVASSPYTHSMQCTTLHYVHCKEVQRSELEQQQSKQQWNFEHHLGYFPGFIKPNQFIGSINQIAQGSNLSEDLFTHFYDVSLNSNTYTSPKKYGISAPEVQGVHERKQNLTQNKKQVKRSEPFDCSSRKTAYNGIVVQRNPFTKDLKFPPKRLECNSILGTSLFGPENPFTDRQSHFFGQRRFSPVDVNVFQRDYLRQLGKETLLQSNPKEFTYGASAERVKILSFSKAINSFLSKKRKYTYLLEEKDQWHLLFQEQLRTALEDTRKYPPLTTEESKDHGPGRIKVSAPLMMARFPKRSNCHKVLAHYNGIDSALQLLVEIPQVGSSPFHSSGVKPPLNKSGKNLHSPIDLPCGIYSSLPCSNSLRECNKATNASHAIFTETWSDSFHSAPLLDKSSFALGNNNLSVFLGQQWFTQEPLNANSWLIISQWSFLVALLFWIEQTFLADIFPALFALEQLLLGTTGMKSDDRTHVTRVSKGEIPKFKDIAGIDGLLGELAELVLFLRGHKKRLWNKVAFGKRQSSYGVLLTGPPGTGKTFLVRALANEAKVPVLILSAGVLTANKTNNSKPSWSIRHAFRRAKQLAPCILFIDEIDALGRSRGNIVTDINEIVASAPGGQNVQATPLSNFNFFNHLENSVQLPAATLANTSLQQQLLSASETKGHQIQATKSLRELASQGKSISAYNQIDQYSLCADASWLINALPRATTRPSQGAETTIPSIGNKTLSTCTEGAHNQPRADLMQTKENIKRKFGPLTQLLVSMDGVSNLSGVLIIGATNRPESLDPALTRPGRFERIIRVEKPAEQKRIEILKLYSRNLGIQKQIPWSYLANRTMGLTAADLAVAMNYSSLKAILQSTQHTIETIEYGLNSIARFSSREVKQKQPVINKKSTEKVDIRFAENQKPYILPGAESFHKSFPSHLECNNPYSLDVAFLATCKEQRLTKSLDFIITPSVLDSQIALHDVTSCVDDVDDAHVDGVDDVDDGTDVAEGKTDGDDGTDGDDVTSSMLHNSTDEMLQNPNHVKKQVSRRLIIDVNSNNRSILITASCISDTPPSASASISDFFSLTTKTNKLEKKRLQRLTEIAYYQSGKIVVQTLLPLHPPVALITLNLSGITTATSADTYIPIDGELNTHWCSFLESRLMGLYGGKASSLLLNRQHLFSLFSEEPECKGGISDAPPSDKPYNAALSHSMHEVQRSEFEQQGKRHLGYAPTLRVQRFIRGVAIDPLARSQIHFTGSAKVSEGKRLGNALSGASNQPLQGVINHGNLFQSNIGTEEIQTATFLAAAMVNRWGLSYSCTSSPEVCADSLNLLNGENNKTGDDPIAPYPQLVGKWLSTTWNNCNKRHWEKRLVKKVGVRFFTPFGVQSASSMQVHETGPTELITLCTKDTNLMNNLFYYIKDVSKCNYIESTNFMMNDSEERYHSSLENDKPLLFTKATYFKRKNNSHKKGRKQKLEREQRSLPFESTSFNISSVELSAKRISTSSTSSTQMDLATFAIAPKFHYSPIALSSPMRELGCSGSALEGRQKVTRVSGKSKKFVSSFTTSLISKAGETNCTFWVSREADIEALSYSPGRVSIEDVAITIPLRTHVFQLVNPLQFSISQRDRFYPGWFRLYLPDIEATEFMKNVANYYYSQGLQTLTRTSSIFDRRLPSATYASLNIRTEKRDNLVSSFSKQNKMHGTELMLQESAGSAEFSKKIISAREVVHRRCNKLDKSFLRNVSSVGLCTSFGSASEMQSTCASSTSSTRASHQPHLEDACQKLPFDYNDASFLEKELIYHSLVNNCFSKAFFLIDQNRPLTDYFADYLVRFQILRQHQILYLFSTVLFSCKKQT